MLLIFVIPTFESMFASVGMALPLPTRIVIGVSQLPERLLVGRASLAIGGAGLRASSSTTPPTGGKLVIDRLLLKAPVLGDVLRKSAVSRFTRTLGTLISSGVSDPRRPRDHGQDRGQPRHPRRDHGVARQSIAGGETIAAPLQKSKVFPPMVICMIAVGEQTGGLDEMLTQDRRLLR